MSRGVRYGFVTVAGTGAAMVVQLTVTAFGLTSLLGAMGSALSALRWCGVAYLIALGIAAWRAPADDLPLVKPDGRSAWALVLRGFFVALTNPKTLFFYGAFFPQFLDRHAAPGPQIAMLAATFLVLAVLIDGCWALLAGRLARLLIGHAKLRQRLTGGIFVVAGLGLATRSAA